MRNLIFLLPLVVCYSVVLCLPVDKKVSTDHLPNANAKVEEEIDNLVCLIVEYYLSINNTLDNNF